MKKIVRIHVYSLLFLGALFILEGSCRNSETNTATMKTDSFTDLRDGKVYKTVKIGDQWVMAENFAFKPDQGRYWAYANDTSNVAKYGYLYDWETAQKVAPEGWHVPTKKEWKTLRKSLGSRADIWSTMKKVYKQMVFGGSSGFNALFGGAYISAYGEFRGIGKEAYFWSSTLTSDGPTNYVLDRENGEAFLTDYADSRGGKSVRLFKD